MKRFAPIICMTTFLSIVLCIMLSSTKPHFQLEMDANSQFILTYNSSSQKEIIHPWFDETQFIYYFFLPSFADDNSIGFHNLVHHEVYINNETLPSDCTLHYDESLIYFLSVDGNTYPIMFKTSENIPSLFIETASGSMDTIHENKEHSEPGSLSIFSSTGILEYNGLLEQISGRGNSLWTRPKKSYSFKLQESSSLCGLEKGKKWVLLSLYDESTKLSTKLSQDIAKTLHLNYASEGTWVDVYLNGSYNGLYLLTEAVCIANGRVEIDEFEENSTQASQGGYLIEKDFYDRYIEEDNGFITNQSYAFTVKSPSPVSVEQLDYISSRVQKIENMIINDDSEIGNYIDMDSFAKKFLLDEILYNYDANLSSAFFYKPKDSDKLYAGPPWDYDFTLGRHIFVSDYSDTILSLPEKHHPETLRWYSHLYSNQLFYKALVTSYEEILPQLTYLSEYKIDEYAATIQKAVSLDNLRWTPSDNYFYSDYINNIKYLKYLLSKRINYLCNRWEIESPQNDICISDGSTHQIQFIVLDGATEHIVQTITVTDGECIPQFPPLADGYLPWYLKKQAVMINENIPVFTDLDIHTHCIK